MKKRSLLALVLAICLTLAMTTQAFAAAATDGEGALAPLGDGSATQESTGQAAINSADGTKFYTENDDDAIDKTTDVGGADINVWAKVVDSGSKIYKVDLAWGAMKFEFNSGSGQWNTATHAYDSVGGTTEWTPAYIDGANNKVAVTNHSNNAIDAGFSYAMDGTPFNDALTDNAVIGNFFADNTKALTASTVLTNTYTGGAAAPGTIADTLTGAKISLPTADKYNSTAGTGAVADDTNNQIAGARVGDVYFAFSGTPDEGRGATLDTFRKVGVITVTVAPNNDIPLNRPAFNP